MDDLARFSMLVHYLKPNDQLRLVAANLPLQCDAPIQAFAAPVASADGKTRVFTAEHIEKVRSLQCCVDSEPFCSQGAQRVQPA